MKRELEIFEKLDSSSFYLSVVASHYKIGERVGRFPLLEGASFP